MNGCWFEGVARQSQKSWSIEPMTVDSFVHCHVCPLKDLCKFQATDDSYNFRHDPDEKVTHWNLGRLQMATVNCPLRKVLEAEQ